MQSFWDGFEKRAELKKEGLFGVGDIAHAIGTHVVPNTMMLKALKSKRVAEHIGDHFSGGLFNTPVTHRSAFASGLAAGVAPEIPLLHQEARATGTKLREFLGESMVHHLGTESGVAAMKEVMRGNAPAAMKHNPELTERVLEFAKQNKVNPFTLAINMKNLGKNPDHPLIHNIAPNLFRLPRRVKAKPSAPVPKPGSPEAMEAEMQNVLDQQSMKRFIPKGLRGKKPSIEPDDVPIPSGPKLTGNPAQDDSALEEMARSYTHPKTTRMKKMVGDAYDRAMGAGPNTETYIPPFEQMLKKTESSKPWTRGLGAMVGSAGVGAALQAPVSGAVNAGKYLYFGTPAGKALKSKLRFNLKGKDVGLHSAEDMLTTGRLRGAFEKGLVHDKPLNPITNAFHRYMFSGIQGEAARTSNAVGRGMAEAIPPEHRKNVYENVMGALRGTPGSLQANSPKTPLREQLKPFAAPAAISAGAGALAYGAGKLQNKKEQQGRPQVAPGGNVLPLMRPPQMEAAG